MVRSSSKRANIWNICTVCLCSPSSRTLCYLAVKPQVTFASLSSPAVMDVRRLRRRLLENMHLQKFRKRHAKHKLKFCQHCLISRQQSLKILAFHATMSSGFDNVDNQKVMLVRKTAVARVLHYVE